MWMQDTRLESVKSRRGGAEAVRLARVLPHQMRSTLWHVTRAAPALRACVDRTRGAFKHALV